MVGTEVASHSSGTILAAARINIRLIFTPINLFSLDRRYFIIVYQNISRRLVVISYTFLTLKKTKMRLERPKSCVQRWFSKFRSRDFSIEDAPHSERPTEIESHQMKVIVDENPRSTVGEILNSLQISY